jgi:hypothetical protein
MVEIISYCSEQRKSCSRLIGHGILLCNSDFVQVRIVLKRRIERDVTGMDPNTNFHYIKDD